MNFIAYYSSNNNIIKQSLEDLKVYIKKEEDFNLLQVFLIIWLDYV